MTADAACAANDNSAAGATATPSVEHFNESASKQIEGSSMTIIAEPSIPAKREPGHTARTVPAIEHIIAAPLDQLLAEQDARIVIPDIAMPFEFFGQLVCKGNGSIILAMPAGRDQVERDAAARMLIAEFHGLNSDTFPDSMIATTTIRNGEWVL
ncbi:hypothetical protein ACFQ71_12335 [Streptomyces sp. NPDC056534]|uniref:hypothetical protein n=1 Tax=Streptomyces sp. NPDC056534 TaxID=3345857 RepID=UPI0036882E21